MDEPWDRLTLGTHVALSILRAADAAGGEEACGLLLGPERGVVTEMTEGRNVADRPERAFEIDPGHLARVQRGARLSGLSIVGCWHSHPNGSTRPSAADVAGALWPGLDWLIVGGGVMAAWRPAGAVFQPLCLVRPESGL